MGAPRVCPSGGRRRGRPVARRRGGLDGADAILPDGSRGRVIGGGFRTRDELTAAAVTMSPERWALDRFGGTSYAWGGLTPWGVDCSGLVQTTFLARGITLPRDTAQQVTAGQAVAPGEPRQGD